jgi:hypothetical protein
MCAVWTRAASNCVNQQKRYICLLVVINAPIYRLGSSNMANFGYN